jgi:hypothetical protein
MDSSVAGQVIAEQLEAIERDYAGSDDHQIGAVITIVEVTGPNSSELRVRSNLGGQPYRLLGFLRVAEEQAISQFRGETG